VSLIGWDELLKTRSAVFVMEEEYRMQKAAAEVPQDDGSTLAPNGHVNRSEGNDDDASIRGMASADDVHAKGSQKEPEGIPTIRISTESDREREAAERKAAELESEPPASPADTENDTIDTSSEADVNGDEVNVLEKPVQAAAGPENEEAKTPSPQDAFSFSNKRLCERWLDNLFMVLYEVSRRQQYRRTY
jgi:Chs5-Arf1p-binding protein BUD7/BCH1